jgi:hypothetical protein
MPYYQIKLKLTARQSNLIYQAIQKGISLTLKFTPNQIGDSSGDTVLVSKKQYDKLIIAQLANNPISVNFSKTQLAQMSKQIGHGILDSIGKFFKSAASSVGRFAGRAYSKIKNEFAPPAIWPADIDNYKPPKNSNSVVMKPTAPKYYYTDAGPVEYGGKPKADWKQQKLGYEKPFFQKHEKF